MAHPFWTPPERGLVLSVSSQAWPKRGDGGGVGVIALQGVIFNKWWVKEGSMLGRKVEKERIEERNVGWDVWRWYPTAMAPRLNLYLLFILSPEPKPVGRQPIDVADFGR